MIYVNGDSWTGGRYNIPYVPTYWPTYFSKLVKQPVHNAGLGGGSNRRIFRTTVEFLMTSSEMPSAVILGWTSAARAELPNARNQTYACVTPQRTWAKDFSLGERENITKFYYQYCYNEYSVLKETLLSMLVIQEMCNTRQIPLVNFQSFEDMSSLIGHNDELLALKGKLDLTRWSKVTMQNETSTFGKTDTGHTDDSGNEHWARFLYEKFFNGDSSSVVE